MILPRGIISDPTLPEIPASDIEVIRKILADRTGFQLSSYKDKCVRRRISIRIRATHSSTAAEYCTLLAGDDRELAHLVKVLTIHVSHFFRNPSTFQKLRQEIIPALFSLSQKAGGRPLTFWSVGCSTGEEPYSLALLLLEHFAGQAAVTPVSILASDVNAAILDQARDALYGPERLGEVPPDLVARRFTPEGDRFRLCDEARAMVDFCRADLVSADPFPACDLILCRNVLIYFERPQQEVILKRFAGALAGGGFLVLGKSETLVGGARGNFQTVCPVERIYRATQ